MQEPKESHAAALKQVIRYLRGTCTLGIRFQRGKGMKLEGYSDSSHNVDIDDVGKAQPGMYFILETFP